MDETQKKWYVIKTTAAKELKIKGLIEKEALNNKNLKDKIGRIIIPTGKSLKIKKSGEKVLKEETYYTGYIMLELTANLDAEITHIIRSIPGVSGFIGKERNGLHTPLRKDEVDRLLNNDLNQESIQIPFMVGENVKIINKGVFDSFLGSITEITEETGKLKLEVMIFGRPTALELNFTEVGKI